MITRTLTRMYADAMFNDLYVYVSGHLTFTMFM